MQSNNPFRANQSTQPPRPLADSYYAPPPAPPPSQAHPSNSDVESFTKIFDDTLSLHERPQVQSPPPVHQPHAGYLQESHSAMYPNPAPSHGSLVRESGASSWSSLRPPPYSERSPSAPPGFPEHSHTSMPDSRANGAFSPPSPNADEKPHLRDHDREYPHESARDARPSRSAGPSFSHMRSPSETPSASPARYPGPTRPPADSIVDRALARVNPRNPLDPPPEAFFRPVPPHILQGLAPQSSNAPPYHGAFQLAPFPPMTLYGRDMLLEGGFPLLPPPSPMQPHPFSHRDVLEADWVRFLEDLQIAGRLTGGQRVAANVLPMTMSLGIGGFFVTRAIEKGMKRKKGGPVAELVDTWNQYFFCPRQLYVILARGAENLSGNIKGPAPDWGPQFQSCSGLQPRSRRGSSSSSSSSSSSYSSHRGRCHHLDKHAAKAEKHRRKAERKVERRQRKMEKRANKHQRHNHRTNMEERYRLVIVSK